MKRPLDLLIVILLSWAWVPILVITMLAIWISMGAPVFFVQERPGLNGKPFMLIKFRSMRQGDGSDAERLTWLGRLLRSTSLDELPELLNVLRGDMSLVGPRPLLMRYLPRYTPEQARRHELRPGLTGWAQVNGRNAISWEQKFEYDVWYVEHKSLGLDLKILWLTVGNVLLRRGINSGAEETMGEFWGTKEPGKG